MLLNPEKVALSFALLLSISNQQVSSFWFTDSSLFQPQPIQVQETIQQQQIDREVAKSGTTTNRPKSYEEKSETQATNTLIRVAEQPTECSCNLDWIQNQTSSWLYKWLHSNDGLSQMRLLLSNSTGAMSHRRGNNNGDAKRAGHDQASVVNHWMLRPHAQKGNNEQQAGNNKRHPSPSAPGRHSRAHGQQPNGKLAQGPRGPPGPKGETGPKGERGERGEQGSSSMLKVKDRDALFDLGSQVNTSSANNLSSGQLVFVEAEQMLVIRTDFGWRPVQLLPTLFDFRKTIAKFSLSSNEQRRQLMSSDDLSLENDNAIQVGTMQQNKRVGDRSRVAPALGGAKVTNRGRSRVNGINGDDFIIDDGEDDDDEDEDEEEDPFDTNKDDRDYGDEEEEDDEDDDDDDFEDSENDIKVDSNAIESAKRKPQSQGNAKSVIASTQAPTTQVVQTPKRSVVAARSAAALVSATTDDEPQSKLAESSLASTDDGRMKLRIASLNEPFSGNIHGMRGADFECKRNAAKANIKGSFRAFLSSGFQNLNEVVRQNVHIHPVVNMRGEILANSWHDLLKLPTRIGNPLSRIYSFDGRHVATDSNWPNKLVWHGSSNNKMGHRDLNQNCDGWHSDSLSKFGFASPLHSPRANKRRQRKRHLASGAVSHGGPTNQTGIGETGLLLDVVDKYPCRMPLIVLCIETIGQQSQPFRNNLANKEDIESNLVL